ncbi:MAG: hypothetical protein MUP58_03380 [Candidatus Nanohaloarchaeota archaeon QJJ-9]|nr:hypothetical protein [Candidatus Nanohaloarchaeota archaeon QJJ-9]
MVEFEVLESEEMEFGEDEFLQVARKKSVSEEGEEVFLSITRGYFEDGNKRFKNKIKIPLDEEAVEFIVKALPDLYNEE